MIATVDAANLFIDAPLVRIIYMIKREPAFCQPFGSPYCRPRQAARGLIETNLQPFDSISEEDIMRNAGLFCVRRGFGQRQHALKPFPNWSVRFLQALPMWKSKKGEHMTLEDRIRERAHRIWEQEGKPHGRHKEHWERACRELETSSRNTARGGASAGPLGGSTLAGSGGAGRGVPDAMGVNPVRSEDIDDRKATRPATMPGGTKLAGG